MKNTLETFPPVLNVWRSNILSEKVAKLASRAFLFFFFTLQLRDFDIAINQSDARKLSIPRNSKMNPPKNYVKFPLLRRNSTFGPNLHIFSFIS